MIDTRLTVEALKALLSGLPNVLVLRFHIELANGVTLHSKGDSEKEHRP